MLSRWFGLRLHDSGCPVRPSPSRFWVPGSAFAFTTLAARFGNWISTSWRFLIWLVSCPEKLWGTPSVRMVVCDSSHVLVTFYL